MRPLSVTPPPPRYRLVIFDMDGTLTEEILDFDAIRRDLAVPAGAGILEHISHLPPAPQRHAQEILHRHEIAAARACIVHDGAVEVLETLKSRGIQTALLTRNSSACADEILSRHALRLDYVATRDHLPHKPHANSILNITRHFGVLPEQTLMVGDYLYDLQAAKNAGTDSALLHMEDGPLPPFAGMATYTLRRLRDVLDLVLVSGAAL